MVCLALLQGIFLTQGSNPGSPTLQVDSLPSEPPAKPLRGQVLHFSPGSRLPRADGVSVSTRTRDPSLFTDEETEGQRGLVTCPGSHSGRQQLQFQAHLPPSTPTPVPGPEELPTRVLRLLHCQAGSLTLAPTRQPKKKLAIIISSVLSLILNCEQLESRFMPYSP